MTVPCRSMRLGMAARVVRSALVEMEVEDVRPVVVGQLVDRVEGSGEEVCRVADADVVDEDVDAAEPAQRLVDEELRAIGGGEVDADVEGSGGEQLRCDRTRPGDDAGAFGEQGPHDGETDAAATAGDDRGAAVEIEVHVDLLALGGGCAVGGGAGR